MIIDDIVKGKDIAEVKKDDIIKLVREVKGVRAKISVVRDGESKDLSEVIKGKTKSSTGLVEEGTPSQDRGSDDEGVG